ncbi:VWA domain-containing protein [Terriglobus roseus]|uniref:VWFA-related domain-containing protein n=1 Tax=Terriglobus roseus TaxID=392734 RepID=A0A1G7FMK6_9BACT|nr:VWA domain-containing protein [Terriglobus roseus]SDE77084.1 VWFA-related domain-containing protein [Terriglobus roseus]
MKSLVLIATLALANSALSQQIGTNQPQGQDGSYTLSVKSQLVTEAVVIKDKSGKFIPNLTANDFTVTEDGTPQKIRVFEHESLPVDAEPLPKQDPNDEQVKIYKRLARTSFQQSAQYKDKRLIAMYFDMSAMRPDDQLRALQSAEKFIRTQMTSADMVSILRYQVGSVDVLLDFSQDRNKMLSILETMIVGEGQGNDETVSDDSSADTGAAFGQDSGEFNIFNTDRQLSALQTAASMLGAMNEKKILLYFASGLRLNGNDNQAQLHATVEAAVKSGVSFWPIDARGLVATPPLGDASQGSPGGQGMYSGTAATAVNDRFQQSQDTLYALAADTGGKAFFDNNDLDAGIVRAQKAITDYYLIGYYTTNTSLNGAFRKIKITVADSLNASLDYRKGYYANKEFGKFNGTEKERQLEDALMLGDPITELTIAMELNYFQLNRAEYFVPLTVKIPGRELALAKKFGSEHTVIDFVCEIKDEIGGNTVTNLRDNVDVKISDATAAELAKRPIEYSTGFTLLPGRYSIKFLARDDETGRIGTYQTSFIIPNLNKETKKLPISSVILSNQRVDTKSALFNTMKGKDQAKADAVNPLMSAEGKLIPSVTRVFRTDRDLEILLQAYQGAPAAPATAPATPGAAAPAASARGPLVAYVSVFRDGKKAMETQAVKAEPIAESRLGTTPIRMKVALTNLTAGEYDIQVTVLDPAGNRIATWRGPMAIAR